MKSAALSMLTFLAAVGAGFCPVQSVARALDLQLDCKSDAHTFIAPLLDDQSIDPKPMRVEANSVNAFRPTRGSNLTAFGFRVYAVLGYQRDDALFKQGDGQPIPGSAYGVVVLGSMESVGARVQQAGSDAVVHQVVPLVLTAIFCNPQ
ncbi:MAG TPA: hypothetical protein VGL08_01850 [Paraburkholderia sp.]